MKCTVLHTYLGGHMTFGRVVKIGSSPLKSIFSQILE